MPLKPLKENRSSVPGDSFNPVLVGLLSGLYPLLFYYSRNFQMNNSWEQVLFFIGLFLLAPILLFVLVKVFSRYFLSGRITRYVLPFLSVFLFLFFLKMVLYSGLQKKMILGIIIIAALATYFLHQHLKKWLILQAIFAGIGLISFLPVLYKHLSYAPTWTSQPDDIVTVQFKKRPNVYYIQPDGYVNFSTLEADPYNVDNSSLEMFLADKGFVNYPNFRSNYISTLTSNSATFMMKHHYYNFSDNLDEIVRARKMIITENPVLSIFQNNGYKTHFISEKPYLLVNRPKSGYDSVNFDYNELPFLSTGLSIHRSVYADLSAAISKKEAEGNFFFIEFFEPGHITSLKAASKGKDIERDRWLEKLSIANGKLEQLVDLIVDKDPNALIMIMADHGGFVGLDYTMEVYNKTTDSRIIYSIFGSMLSIRWPDNAEPEVAKNLKTSVNVFRILFAYLGNDQNYLHHLQEDKSYIILREGAVPGVYEYIDEDGKIVCNRIERK